MMSALVVDTKEMNIVQMVLVVTRLIALACDLRLHSYNMARAHKFKDYIVFSIDFHLKPLYVLDPI